MTAMKKSNKLIIFLFSLASLSAHSHVVDKRKGCWVGDMACAEYCRGALKVKLFMLIGQGLKPLCDIKIHYSSRKGGYCVVNLDGVKQRFYERDLITIARTKYRTRFNALLTRPFLHAVYRCPSPDAAHYKGYII